MPSRHVGRAALAICFLAPFASAAAAEDEPTPRHYERDHDVDIEHVRIELTFDLPQESAAGNCQLTVRGIQPEARRIELMAQDFALGDVTVDGRACQHDYDGATIGLVFDP